MHKPPREHDEWLEENQKKPKKSLPPKKEEHPFSPDTESGASERFKALNDDIQEFG